MKTTFASSASNQIIIGTARNTSENNIFGISTKSNFTIVYTLEKLPKIKLSQLLNKPVSAKDGALLPLGGVTFSLSSLKIKHLIVRMEASPRFTPAPRSSLSPSQSKNAAFSPLDYLKTADAIGAKQTLQNVETTSPSSVLSKFSPYESSDTLTFSATAEQENNVSEIYLPYYSSHFSAWRIIPQNNRPCSPKGTSRLLLNKRVYSTSGVYYGKLSDAIIKSGRLSLLFISGAIYSAENLYAAGDALLLRPCEPYPLGQKLSEAAKTKLSGDKNVSLPDQVTKATLKYYLRQGKLIELTTSLPLFQK